MTQKQWKLIIGINLLAILAVLSPFLPGPSFMSIPTNFIFSLLQLGSLLGLLLAPVGVIWTSRQSKKKKEYRKILPILLLTVPILIFIFSFWGAGTAREISRTIAINNAGKLIDAIESYRVANNHYPDDILELKPKFLKSIPKPCIMGISGYSYEKKDDAYSLAFTQNVIISFNFEVVVYDPTENHKSESELKTLYDTGKCRWKYYVYD